MIFGTPDTNKYEALKLASKDLWDVLMKDWDMSSIYLFLAIANAFL